MKWVTKDNIMSVISNETRLEHPDEYTLIEFGDKSVFVKEINKFLSDGWYLFGVSFSKGTMFCQALVKYSPRESTGPQ